MRAKNFEPGLLEHDVDLLPVGRGAGVEIDHDQFLQGGNSPPKRGELR